VKQVQTVGTGQGSALAATSKGDFRIRATSLKRIAAMLATLKRIAFEGLAILEILIFVRRIPASVASLNFVQ